jgi:transcriptional regulator with AAA-type ATPase domain
MQSIWLYIDCMGLFSDAERRFLTAVARLGYSNPFLKERIELERTALGKQFVPGEAVWSAPVTDRGVTHANVARMQARLDPMIESVRKRLDAAAGADPADLVIYEECVHQLIYYRYNARMEGTDGNGRGSWSYYRDFAADWRHYLEIPGVHIETALDPHHVFACFRQLVRAFRLIFYSIIGNSMPAARLRAAVWQSVFTHDMRRYRRTMYARMRDFPTLITGPSGTGKELVARAIAGSRYIPFDPKRMEFADPAKEFFFPVNLAALSPTLIESELFGHRRGAFTGAIEDRKGWLEACPPTGTVFLDELGEMDLSIQVKLLRVMETRRFSAVGDTAPREFSGKLIAATNRDLPVEIRAGRFREDLYYRLCADQIHTPSLHDQALDSPELLDDLLLYMVRRSVGDEAERVMPEVRDWVRKNLPADYAWPGNYRELEQCVRNIVIHGSYHPLESGEPAAEDAFFGQFRRGELTAEDVVSHYAAVVYRQAGSYEEAARRLELDRRTVKAKVEAFLQRSL